MTPLMKATNNWNVRIVDYLIERGVDPFIKDKYGFTAKDKAKLKNHRTIFAMLDSYEKRYSQDYKKKGPII